MVSRAVEAARWPRRSGRSSAAQPLGGLAQPPLGNAGEVQRAGKPEHGQLPHVLGPFLLRVGQRAVQLGQQRPQQPPRRSGGWTCSGPAARSSTLAARRACSRLTRQRSEVGRVRSPASVRRCSPASSSAITRSGRPRSTTLCAAALAGPACRAQIGQDGAGVPAAVAAPRGVMRVAQPVAVRRRRRARRHDAGAERGQRRHVRAGQPLPERQAQVALPLPLMGAAQPVRRPARARAAGHLAGPVTAGPADRAAGRGTPPTPGRWPSTGQGMSRTGPPRRSPRRRRSRPPRIPSGPAAGRARAGVSVIAAGLPARPGQEIRPQRRPQHRQVIPGRPARAAA